MALPARTLLLALLLGCVAPLAGAGRCTAPDVLVVDGPASVRVWERFESVAFLDHGDANPFDPDVVDVRAQFVAPDGEMTVMPAFAMREYGRELVGGYEKLHSPSVLHWRVRFTPDRPGTWRWRWLATTPAGGAESEWRELRARPPAPGRHGFLRVSRRDPRYLRFDDDTPYFAIGENLAWYDGRGTFAYDDWFERLAAEGVNYVRLWMPSWAFSIEWEALGDYSGRLDRAWQLDRVLEAAEAHDIYVMLNVQNHGPFSLDANRQWDDNPYNAANGGPLATPEEFFSDPEARALFRRRLRYVVARWGYSTHVLAWELWNELNLIVDTERPDVADWHREMAGELRALDPWDHLVTTSVSLGAEHTTLWLLPEIDFTQSHTYNFPFLLDHATLLHTFNVRTRVPGKPTLIGETGADYRGPAETLATDPSSIAFHDGLWAGLATGTFGTGMTWWWDNVIDPQDLYSHFGAVAAFVDGLAFDEHDFAETRPVAQAPGRRLDAWALQGRDLALVWIKNLDHRFFPPTGHPGDPVPVTGADLALDGLVDGPWAAHWYDTRTGARLATELVDASGGRLVLPAPPFTGDIALRLQR